MTPSYHSKKHLCSKQGSSIFLLFGSLSVGLSQSFSDNSNLIILVDIINVCMKAVNEFYVFVTGFIFCLKEALLLPHIVLRS